MRWLRDRQQRRAARAEVQAEQARTRAVITQALSLVREINRLAEELERYRYQQQGRQDHA